MNRLIPFEKLQDDYYIGESIRDGMGHVDSDDESSDDEVQQQLREIAGYGPDRDSRGNLRPICGTGVKSDFEIDMDAELDSKMDKHVRKTMRNNSKGSTVQIEEMEEGDDMPPLEAAERRTDERGIKKQGKGLKSITVAGGDGTAASSSSSPSGASRQRRQSSLSLAEKNKKRRSKEGEEKEGGGGEEMMDESEEKNKKVRFAEEVKKHEEEKKKKKKGEGEGDVDVEMKEESEEEEDEGEDEDSSSSEDEGGEEPNPLKEAARENRRKEKELRKQARKEGKEARPDFYDAGEDEANEAWVQAHRRKAQGREGEPARKVNPKQVRLEDGSDAVLSCPGCMTLLTRDCQRHELYNEQYRAMFVENCVVDESERVSVPKSGKDARRERQKRKKQVEAGMSLPPVAAEVFTTVRCAACTTKVAVLDEEEVYHFFNVLAGYS